MTWQIYVDGKFVGGEVTEIRQELNGPETAKFMLSNDIVGRMLVSEDQAVIIKFLNTTVFTGVLQGIKYQQRYLECTAYDAVYDALSKKVIDDDYETDIETILGAVATVAGVSSSTTDPGSVTHTVTFNQTVCYDAVKFLAQLANLDYYSSGGTTIIIGTRGTDRGKVPVEGVSRRGIDRHQKRDKVLIRGQDATGAKLTGTAGAGTDVAVFTEKKAQTQESLNALAANYLAQLNKDSSGVNLTINMVYAYPYQPGDSITVVNPDLNLNGSYRIWRITKRGATATVEVDVPEALLERLIEKQKSLEDLGIITYGTSLDDPAGAPATVSGVDGTNQKAAIKIAWTENTEADLDYYEIWRADTLGGAKSKIADARTNYFTDVGTAYNDYQFYSIKAVDRAGNVSASYSNVGSGKALQIDGGSDLVAGTIDTLQLANEAVEYAKIAINAISGAVIKAGAITRTKLFDGAVTSGVLAAQSITRTKLLNGVVTSGVIAAGTITASEMKAGSITSAAIRANTITAGNIAAGTITASEMKAGSITTNAIRAGTIEAADIAAGTITASEMKAGSITTDAIRAGTIAASNIAAGAIGADQIAAGAVTALKMATDTITVGFIDNDMELYFPFEEGTGTTIHDMSGNDITGTASNNTWETGIKAKGLGITGADDGVDLDTSITLTGAFTVSGWFKVSAYTSNPGIVGHDTTINTGGRITMRSTRTLITVTVVGGTATDVTISQTLPIDTWFHLAITRDSSNNIDVYYNGSNVTSGTPTATGSMIWRKVAGNPDNSSYESLNGVIDEFYIYSRTLTATEIYHLSLGIRAPSASTVIDGGRIRAGTIEADQIAAGEITADKLTITGIDGSGDLVLGAIGSGSLDDIPDGTTYKLVLAAAVTGGYIKTRQITGSVGSYSAADYAGQAIYFSTEDTVYYSNGSTWTDTGLSDEDVWGYTTRKLTAIYAASSYTDIEALGAAASNVPAAGKFIVAITGDAGAIKMQAIGEDGSTWRDIVTPEGSDVATQLGEITLFSSPLYCDGSTVRIYNSLGVAHDVRYWYFTEDT